MDVLYLMASITDYKGGELTGLETFDSIEEAIIEYGDYDYISANCTKKELHEALIGTLGSYNGYAPSFFIYYYDTTVLISKEKLQKYIDTNIDEIHQNWLNEKYW